MLTAAGIAGAAQVHAFDTSLELVIAIDTLVERVHFSVAAAPADVGFKALAINLSDLAAMGADPLAARASLTHPDNGEEDARRWLDAFGEGLGALAQRFAITVAHPLTARGPSVTIWLPRSRSTFTSAML